jgi:hypothetical protein
MEKRKLSLVEDSQLMNREGMTEAENCYLATILVLNDSSKNQLVLLKLENRNLKSNKIFIIVSKYLSVKDNEFINYKRKNNNFVM